MGNTVSAHIYEIKVFRPYPDILYRLRLDHSIHWWKKLVSLGTTKIGVLDGKASTHVRRNPHLKSMGNTVFAHIYEIKVFRPYPVILYRLRLDHSIHWWKKKKNWCPSERPKLAYSAHSYEINGKASTHVRSPFKINGKLRPYPVILYRLRLDHSIHWWKKIGVPRNDQNWRTRW